MEESYPMTGGEGPYSYAKNSNLQKDAAENAKGLLVTAIAENLDVEHVSPTSNTFRVADLGCSVGPNTYIAMKTIIEAVAHKYEKNGHESPPEFQVFFNDHVSNDFNILFANLPPERQYFAVGVPGSFHNRLFPKAFLNFVYSAYAIQWLSKVPQELGDLDSPLCNKGRIFYSNAPNEVAQAYSAQYAKDIQSFLGARAQELAPGGLMALLIPGRLDGTLPTHSSLGTHFQLLESTLIDMADQGIISKEKIDSFNLPMYSPSREELRELILENGCFEIVRLDRQPQKFSRIPTTVECRAGLEGILSQHFGIEIMDQLFGLYSNKIEGHLPISADDGFVMGLCVLLKRKH